MQAIAAVLCVSENAFVGQCLTKRTTTTKFPECLRWNWWFSSDGSISPVLPSHSHPYFIQLGNVICQCKRRKRCRFDPWVWKIPWRRKCQPTPVFLLGESHGQKNLAGYSPWGHKELDTTERAQSRSKTFREFFKRANIFETYKFARSSHEPQMLA